MNIITKTYKSIFGELIVGSFYDKLCILDWKYRKKRDTLDKRIQNGLNAKYIKGNSEIIEKTISQIDEYSIGERQVFDIPLLFVGSNFQKQVWKALTKIPYGKTESYLTLSKMIGNEKAVRAVANANGANAISILVPCHRIIGKNGSLVGYAGGINVKKKLLEIERKICFPTNDLFSKMNN